MLDCHFLKSSKLYQTFVLRYLMYQNYRKSADNHPPSFLSKMLGQVRQLATPAPTWIEFVVKQLVLVYANIKLTSDGRRRFHSPPLYNRAAYLKQNLTDT